MSMCDTARKVLERTCVELKAARARRDDIEDAIAMLANAGVSKDILESLDPELEKAKEEVRDLMIQRFIMRAGMRAHGWLADGE